MTAPRWRILIVDDEAPARRILRELVEERPDATVVGEAGTVEAAEILCRSSQRNLILLDIQLARANGFDLLERLDPPPKVIFVTAFDQYAVRAFDVAAVDYLMKPVSAPRLDQALAKADQLNPQDGLLPPPFHESDKVYLPCSREVVLVEVGQITCVQAEGNFSRVHLTDGAVHLVSRILCEWGRLLPEDAFVRLDRSTLVNVKHIRHLKMRSRDEGHLWMTGAGEGIVLGRTALARIREWLRR